MPVEEVCPAHGEQEAKMTMSRFEQGCFSSCSCQGSCPAASSESR